MLGLTGDVAKLGSISVSRFRIGDLVYQGGYALFTILISPPGKGQQDELTATEAAARILAVCFRFLSCMLYERIVCFVHAV